MSQTPPKAKEGIDTKHVHTFGEPQVVRITKIDNPNYVGTAGDMAFIMHRCKCGRIEAFDYGKYVDMKFRLSVLVSAEKEAQ